MSGGAGGSYQDLAERLNSATELQNEIEQDQLWEFAEYPNVLLNREVLPPNSTRENAAKIMKSFKRCHRLMLLLMRFTIDYYEHEDGSFEFEYSWRSVRSMLFFASCITLTIMSILSNVNMVSTMLDFPKQPENITVKWKLRVFEATGRSNWKQVIPSLGVPQEAQTIINGSMVFNKTQSVLRAEEMFFFRRNLVSLIMVLLLLIHIVTSDWNL